MRVFLLSFFILLTSSTSFADWHGGKVNFIGVGYDGLTITVRIDSWSRDNCTCYPTWPTYMCLNINRQSFEYEKALILAAKARNSILNLHIDEASCMISALYEG